MFGAWGAATASTGKTFQLRSFDWDIDGPFKDYPAVVVYHPSGENAGHPFAIVGFVGWIGGLTGHSSSQMAVSQIGVAFPDASFGQESRIGIPFIFLLRDILQFDNSYTVSAQQLTGPWLTLTRFPYECSTLPCCAFGNVLYCTGLHQAHPDRQSHL